MQRDTRVLMFLCSVLFLLLWGFIWLLTYQTETHQKEIDLPEVTNIHVSTIKSVVVKHENDPYGIISLDGMLYLEPNDKEIAYSLEKMQGFVYILTKLEGMREVEYEDLSPFGFHELSPRIIILTFDERVELILGDSNDLGYYLLNKNNDKLYIVNSLVGELFSMKKTDFLDINLLPSFTSEQLNMLESLSLWSEKSPSRSYTITRTGDFAFTLVSPIKNVLNLSRLYSDILLPLSTIQNRAVVSTSVGKLGNPLYKVSLYFDGVNYELSVFKGEGDYYIRRDGFSYTWEVPFESLAFLETDYMDMVGAGVYYTNIQDISALELFHNGENIAYIAHDQNDESFLSLYSELISIPAIRQETSAYSKDPRFTMILHRVEGNAEVLEVFAINEFEGFLAANGVINFVIPLKYIEEIYRTVNHLTP